MYGKNARNTLMAVLMEAPEMKLGRFPNARDKMGVISSTLARQLTDRVLTELWMRGFAVSARKPADRPPGNTDREPESHKAWRDTKMTA